VDAPIDPGPAEIRYMSGQGARVLARRPILAVAPKVTLHAPARAPAGSMVTVEWTGPKNNGDYLTIVPKSARDGTSFQTAPAARGSPSKLGGPAAPGACEVRYMSGQGNRVLARVDLELVAAP
jgi:Ca-activated chloride channel family protein